MAIVVNGAPRAPKAPGFARAFGRATVFGFQRGVTVPLAGVAVQALVPGSDAPWPDPLYTDESDTTPAVFPVPTDAGGAVALWSDTAGRVELLATATGYGPQRVVLDLEYPPPGSATDPYPDYLTQGEADALYAVTLEGGQGVAVTQSPANTYAFEARVSADAGNVILLHPDGLFSVGSVVDAYTKTESDARYPQKTDADPYPQYAEDTDLSAHVAAADPHPVYLTQSEADARYALISALNALTTRVSTLEAQVATLQSQITGHTHLTGTIAAAGGTAVMP